MATPIAIQIRTPWSSPLDRDVLSTQGDIPITVGAVIDLATGRRVAATVTASLIDEDDTVVAAATLTQLANGSYVGSFAEPGLSAGAFYTLRVRAVFGDGDSASDWIMSA